MDTNVVAALISALSENRSTLPSGNLVLVLITLTPLLAGITAWIARNTAASVELIHKSVNSERTAAIKEIRDLKDEVKSLSAKLAFDAGKKSKAQPTSKPKKRLFGE